MILRPQNSADARHNENGRDPWPPCDQGVDDADGLRDRRVCAVHGVVDALNLPYGLRDRSGRAVERRQIDDILQKVLCFIHFHPLLTQLIFSAAQFPHLSLYARTLRPRLCPTHTDHSRSASANSPQSPPSVVAFAVSLRSPGPVSHSCCPFL